MIQPQEMYAAFLRCRSESLALVLLTGEGRHIGSPPSPREYAENLSADANAQADATIWHGAMSLASSYRQAQPRIGIDLRLSKCMAITQRLGGDDDVLASLQSKLGHLGPASSELSLYAQDGKTKAGRHIREIRLARVTDAFANVKNVEFDGISYVTEGYAWLPTSPVADLGDAWARHVLGIPKSIAAREQAAREEAELWRTGRHPSQQPSPSAMRLLEPFKLSHNGALLDLPAGKMIDDPGLIGALESSGALLGFAADAPRSKSLQPGEVRFTKSFSAALGPGGLQQYREGQVIANASSHFIDEMQRAGALLEVGAITQLPTIAHDTAILDSSARRGVRQKVSQ